MKIARLSRDLHRLKEKDRGPTVIFLVKVNGEFFPAGTDLELGDEVEVEYDHRTLSAFPVLLYPGYYILARDLDNEHWVGAGEIIESSTATIN